MPLWSDLGRRWRMLEQYFKPYPVCRWAHPAVEAVLSILGRHGATAEAVESIEVTSFHEAVRLATREPRSTDEAQYSLPFAVAAAAVRGRLGAAEVVGQSLTDPDILRLSRGMRLGESDAFNRLFPAERWATVTIRMVDGRRLRSQPSIARGNPENPLSDAEIAEKFDALVVPVAGRQRAGELRDRIDGLGAPSGRLVPLLNELTRPL
jgi:2-methylcitrate dehydratase PrpD